MWKTFKYTATGNYHSKNQDAVYDSDGRSSKDVIIGVLSDGLGSKPNSEVASNAVIRAVSDFFIKGFDIYVKLPTEELSKKLIKCCRESIDDAIRKYNEDNEDNKYNKITINDMDCTLLFVAIKNNKAIIGHIGDGAVCILSKDTGYQFNPPPYGSGAANIVDQTILNVDEKKVKIEILDINIKKINGFILTSDGLDFDIYYDHSKEIRQNCQGYFSLVNSQKTAELINRINNYQKDGKTNDDVSVVIICRENSEVNLPKDPTWLCSCTKRNSMDDNYCSNCFADFLDLYTDIDYNREDRITVFRKLSEKSQEESKVLESSSIKTQVKNSAASGGALPNEGKDSAPQSSGAFTCSTVDQQQKIMNKNQNYVGEETSFALQNDNNFPDKAKLESRKPPDKDIAKNSAACGGASTMVDYKESPQSGGALVNWERVNNSAHTQCSTQLVAEKPQNIPTPTMNAENKDKNYHRKGSKSSPPQAAGNYGRRKEVGQGIKPERSKNRLFAFTINVFILIFMLIGSLTGGFIGGFFVRGFTRFSRVEDAGSTSSYDETNDLQIENEKLNDKIKTLNEKIFELEQALNLPDGSGNSVLAPFGEDGVVDTTDDSLKDGQTYLITNAASGKALGVYTKSTEKYPEHDQNMAMGDYLKTDPAFRWTLENDEETFIVHSATKNVVLSAYAYAYEPKVNVRNVDTQKWIFDNIGENQYIIRLKSNRDLVLTANSKENNSGCSVNTYEAENAFQKWTLDPYIEEK